MLLILRMVVVVLVAALDRAVKNGFMKTVV